MLAALKRARGLRGEIFADSLGTRRERFVPGLPVFLFPPGGDEGKAVEIERAWYFQDRLVLKFAGIQSRTQAEEIERWEVRIPLEQRPVLPEGEYYLSDLVGCSVRRLDGTEVGKVTGWQEAGPQVLLEVGELLIPLIREICTGIEVEKRRIVVSLPDGLEELNAP